LATGFLAIKFSNAPRIQRTEPADAAASLKQPVEGLEQSVSTLEARSPAAPVQPTIKNQTGRSAEELFRTSRACHLAAKALQDVDERISLCLNHQQANDAYYQRCQAALDQYQSQRQKDAARLNECNQYPDQLEAEYFHRTLEAAKAGDADAQLCFMQDDFRQRPRTKDDVDEYDRDSSIYLNLAMKRGDRRAVALMATDPHYLPHSETLLSRLVPGDAVTTFEMNRLLRRAAHGSFAITLDSDGRDLLKNLSDAQATEADAWAKKQYETYFRNSGDLNAMPSVCGE
jgi:hypothetical protein